MSQIEIPIEEKAFKWIADHHNYRMLLFHKKWDSEAKAVSLGNTYSELQQWLHFLNVVHKNN